MQFEWTPAKAASNVKKYKVTFEVAKTFFYDDFAVHFLTKSTPPVTIDFSCWYAAVSERTGTLSASSPLASRHKPNPSTTEVNDMKAEYDLSKMKSRRNPYASKLKKWVTMRLSEEVLQYFKIMATEAGVP